MRAARTQFGTGAAEGSEFVTDTASGAETEFLRLIPRSTVCEFRP